jgi:C4-type Zn-finger protein
MLTNKQYLEARGNCCPSCKSHAISAGSVEADGLYGWAPVCCDYCGYRWVDFYMLTGYEPDKQQVTDAATQTGMYDR